MDDIMTMWTGEERSGEGGQACAREKWLIREDVFAIILDGVRRGSASCTPRDLQELAAGWLLSEGHLTQDRQVQDITIDKEGREIHVRTRTAMVPAASDCMGEGRVWTPRLLGEAWALTQADPPLHEKTRGAHSCAILQLSSEERLQLHWRSEDAGRHSALDKAIGWALLHGVDLGHCLLYTSGRISTRMAMKATAAGAGALAGKGTVTAEALELARQHGMALIGYAGETSAVWFWEGSEAAV